MKEEQKLMQDLFNGLYLKMLKHDGDAVIIGAYGPWLDMTNDKLGSISVTGVLRQGKNIKVLVRINGDGNSRMFRVMPPYKIFSGWLVPYSLYDDIWGIVNKRAADIGDHPEESEMFLDFREKMEKLTGKYGIY